MIKKQTISERLEILIRELGLNSNSFSKALGYSNNNVTIGRIINDKEKSPSYDTLQKILEAFPSINPAWLLTGEAPIFRGEVLKATPDNYSKKSLIPLLPVSAQGGSLKEFLVSVILTDCEQIFSPVKGAELALPVAGDSMYPDFSNGSVVFIKKINEKAFIEWGRVYVLDTCNGIVIKKIVPSVKQDCLRCISINTDPDFVPFDIHMDDIYGVYIVLACLTIK